MSSFERKNPLCLVFSLKGFYVIYYSAVKDGKRRIVQVPHGFRMRLYVTGMTVCAYLEKYGYTDIRWEPNYEVPKEVTD